MDFIADSCLVVFIFCGGYILRQIKNGEPYKIRVLRSISNYLEYNSTISVSLTSIGSSSRAGRRVNVPLKFSRSFSM